MINQSLGGAGKRKKLVLTISKLLTALIVVLGSL